MDVNNNSFNETPHPLEPPRKKIKLSQPFLGNMPSDLLHLIFLNCDFKSLDNLLPTCRSINDFIRSDEYLLTNFAKKYGLIEKESPEKILKEIQLIGKIESRLFDSFAKVKPEIDEKFKDKCEKAAKVSLRHYEKGVWRLHLNDFTLNGKTGNWTFDRFLTRNEQQALRTGKEEVFKTIAKKIIEYPALSSASFPEEDMELFACFGRLLQADKEYCRTFLLAHSILAVYSDPEKEGFIKIVSTEANPMENIQKIIAWWPNALYSYRNLTIYKWKLSNFFQNKGYNIGELSKPQVDKIIADHEQDFLNQVISEQDSQTLINSFKAALSYGNGFLKHLLKDPDKELTKPFFQDINL